MRDELNRLASRVEALTGPDREVDAAIQRALGTHNGEHWFCGADGQLTKDDLAPCYTRSLDAAMSLVPEGWNWGVWMRHDWPKQNAQVWHLEREASTRHGDAATPALALTAASLRTRAELQP